MNMNATNDYEDQNSPHNDAGILTEPAVSVPKASGTKSAATAAAEPPLLLPAILDGSKGFLVGPKTLEVVVAPEANS